MTLRAWVWVGSALALGLAGCSDDGGAGADTDGDASSTGAPTTAPPSTTAPPPTTEPPTTDSATTDMPTTEPPTTDGDSSSSTTTGEDDDSSSSGGAPTDVCVGFNYLGAADQVHFMDDPGPGEIACNPDPAPCGGELEGTWNVAESCGYEVLPNFFAEICDGAEQTITGSQSSGTRTFNDDGTFDFDLVNQLEVDLTVDAMDCVGVSCEAFAALLSEEPEFDMLCEDAKAGGCTCVYTLNLAEVGDGTWDVLGDEVLLTVDGELDGSLDYCVADGRLDMWQPLFTEEVNPDVLCSTERDCETQLGDEFLFYECVEPEDDKE